MADGLEQLDEAATLNNSMQADEEQQPQLPDLSTNAVGLLTQL